MVNILALRNRFRVHCFSMRLLSLWLIIFAVQNIKSKQIKNCVEQRAQLTVNPNLIVSSCIDFLFDSH